MPNIDSVKIVNLGPCQYDSPLELSNEYGDGVVNFVTDDSSVPCQISTLPGLYKGSDAAFELAGPRSKLYFNPSETTAAIVTCGGLCPGLNNVIRSVFNELYYRYGIKNILGIQYGYSGLDPANGIEPITLTPEIVEDIHYEGGTVLGSSRGPVDLGVAVETLKKHKVNLLFTIGGDGTQTGAAALAKRAAEEGCKIALVGIPKTIDNDISFVSKTFGFESAIEKAREVIQCAHVEAKGAPNGIAVVKLMGRDAGFIAAGATIASQEVNFTLVPEVPFSLDGEMGLLNLLEKRILKRKHAVIVIAEGAGQNLISESEQKRDASGNLLHADIGPVLCDRIKSYFKQHEIKTSVKYIDPSYIIRSIPANGSDAILCDQFARNAAHAAMAGKSNLLIGLWYGHFVHVPIPLATSHKKRMNTEGEIWRGALAATGQPLRPLRPLRGGCQS